MSVIPCSNAVRIVSSASRSSVPPHMKPPIAQVPKPMRDNLRFKPFTFVYSIVLSFRSSSSEEIAFYHDNKNPLELVFLFHNSAIDSGPFNAESIEPANHQKVGF